MKSTEYTVIFQIGPAAMLCAFGVKAAIIIAMADRIHRVMDPEIKFVIDEDGHVTKNIQGPTFTT
jgi:hypothetical protein